MKIRFDPRRNTPDELGRHVARMCWPSAFEVVCVGTDRSTGDALGPLIGSMLESECKDLQSWGTIDSPIHAANLHQFVKEYEALTPILAVDACLGSRKHVGTVSLSDRPLRPGAGVQKQLPEVGTMHIAGTVNVNGFMEYYVLQNTRLSLVMAMARWIAEGIRIGAEIVSTGAESLGVPTSAQRVD